MVAVDGECSEVLVIVSLHSPTDLQIRKVTPVTDEKEIFKGKRVPDKIIE